MPPRRKRANRFRGAGDAAAAIEFGDAHLGVGDVALEARDLRGEQRPRGHRGVAVGLEAGNRFGGLPREIFPAAVECRGGADFEIGDAGIGGVEAPALLLVLGDRQGQRPLGAVDGGGRIAHLLVEDEKGIAALQFFSRCSHAAPEKRQNRFEHLQLPVMSIAHGLDIAGT